MKYPTISSTAEPFFFPGDHTGCLLIHGFTGTPKEMHWLGEYLSEQGFTVLGIRLPGHATHPDDMVRTRWWDWLNAVYDGIHMLHNSTDHIFLIGLSMGSALALTAAAHTQVAGVVAMSTPFEVNAGWQKNYLRQISLFRPSVPKQHYSGVNPTTNKEQVSYPIYPTRSLAELVDLLAEMRQSLPLIQNPVLLMQGQLDQTVTIENFETIYNSLRVQEKHSLLFENGGHILTRGDDRFEVYKAIADFIRNYLPSGIN
jgi:carboxylesterase